ncbi:hypothetical protein BT96DRAFT_1007097 [Gymnopus androsaceus JB14]|uniref:Uncharacterized protein n=1 Tax=Gymnopus androsaceus JB14 TaxID=1447944 RepID=A0A6A4GJ55_9AGAR|nr:hypothetical protein BT96DRAFT_1007097 [Gymnopus androsaceus JB14]
MPIGDEPSSGGAGAGVEENMYSEMLAATLGAQFGSNIDRNYRASEAQMRTNLLYPSNPAFATEYSLIFAVLRDFTTNDFLSASGFGGLGAISISRAEIERVRGTWAVKQLSSRGPRDQTRMSPLNHGYGSSRVPRCLTLSPYSGWASALAPSRGASYIYTWL